MRVEKRVYFLCWIALVLGACKEPPSLGELIEKHQESYAQLQLGLERIADNLDSANVGLLSAPCPETKLFFGSNSPNFNADFINYDQLRESYHYYLGPLGHIELSRTLTWSLRAYEDKDENPEVLQYPHYDQEGFEATARLKYVLVAKVRDQMMQDTIKIDFFLGEISTGNILCYYQTTSICEEELEYEEKASCHRINARNLGNAVARDSLDAPLTALEEKEIGLK